MNTKIILELGEKEFSVEIRELNAEEKKSLGEKFKVEQTKVNHYSKLKTELETLMNTHKTNGAILELDNNLSVVEKVKILWEQRKLLSEIRTLLPIVEESSKEPVLFENIAKEQFEMITNGTNKDALMKEIERVGKSYREILSTILVEVQKEKEKKSFNS